jgi:hypothetical protein
MLITPFTDTNGRSLGGFSFRYIWISPTAFVQGCFSLTQKTTLRCHIRLCTGNRKINAFLIEDWADISRPLCFLMQSWNPFITLCAWERIGLSLPLTHLIIKFLIPSRQSIGLWYHHISFFPFCLSPHITGASRFYWCHKSSCHPSMTSFAKGCH